MNVRVILTGVQMWNTGNPVTINAQVAPTLDNFCTWRKENLVGKVPNDMAHLVVYVYTLFQNPNPRQQE
jgi:hypothetical protein